MKHLQILILPTLLFIVTLSFVPSNSKSVNLSDEGIFHLRAFMTEGKDTFDFSKALRLVDSGTYLVKGNKIKRKAYHSWEERTAHNDEATLHTTTEKIENGYLIDFDNELLFSYLPDSPVIRKQPITALSFDFLYSPRAQRITKLRFLSIDTFNVSQFNGKLVHHGTAFMPETGDTAVFLTAKDPLPVKSPVSNWMPGFNHDIVSLAVKYKKNPKTGNVIWFVLEINGITGRKIDPQEFVVDSSKIIRG